MKTSAGRGLMILLLCGAAGGCDDGGGDVEPVDPVIVAPPDAGGLDMQPAPPSPDAATPDAAEPDAAPDAAPSFDDWPPPSADGAPTPVAVSEWMRAMPPLPDDPLQVPYERGEIPYPDPGEAPDGVRWFRLEADEGGEIGGFGITDGYVVGRVPVPPGHAVLVTADRVRRVFTARSMQPGDVYGHGTSLVPLVPEPGADAVIVAAQAIPQRGPPRLRLYTTPDQIVINAADVTFPDLRVGRADPDWLGIPVIETRGWPVGAVEARVVESAHWQGTTVTAPGLPAGAATQIGFLLRPKAPWAEADVEIPLTLEIASPDLAHTYRRTITLTTRAAEGAYRQTFLSPIDASVQYYGVNPPPAIDPDEAYALVLSLHGAGVEAIRQARSYAPKDWAYIIAPTNRRRFGFDWEEWGRFNGLAALDDAQDRFGTDPTRVYLTGHSMGGHGSWHLGVTAPGRFALVGPSAGWASFESYIGRATPDGLFGRARAHSRTLDYISNLARRAVYIIHGDADDNVPVREGRAMYEAVGAVTDDIEYHEQPGAGHWWSAGIGEGTDCVDWPPMFEMMQQRRLDPFELTFDFRSPHPGYSADHSFVRVETAASPLEDVRVSAAPDGATMRLTTTNVAQIRVDPAPLTAAGIDTLIVDDGPPIAVGDTEMLIGAGEKFAALAGPLNQAFRWPFCFIVPDADDPRAEAWRRVAGYWASYWQIVGNGHACQRPAAAADAAHEAGYGLIRVGSAADARLPLDGVPIAWDAGGITLDGTHFPGSSMVMVQRDGDRLTALLVAAEGEEHLIGRLIPFGSGSGLPDYFVYAEDGGRAAGFFDRDWRWDPAFAVP